MENHIEKKSRTGNRKLKGLLLRVHQVMRLLCGRVPGQSILYQSTKEEPGRFQLLLLMETLQDLRFNYSSCLK